MAGISQTFCVSRFLKYSVGVERIGHIFCNNRWDESNILQEGMGLAMVFAGVVKFGQTFSRSDQTVQNFLQKWAG